MIYLLMLIGISLLCLAFPCSIIITIIFYIKKKKILIPAICIPATFFVGIFAIMAGGFLYGQTDEYKEISEQKRIEKEQREESERKEHEKIEQERAEKELREEAEREEQKRIEEERRKQEEISEKIKDEIEEEAEKNQSIESSIIESETNIKSDNIVYEDVFFYTLIDNIQDYNGKNIRTIVEVDRCYETGDSPHIESKYTDYDLSEKFDNITIYPNNYQEFETGEYITVEGIIATKENSEVLIDANIIYYGEISKKEFDDGLLSFKQQREERMEKEREDFISSAQTPTYDDLLRYPDSYKEIKIKVKVKVIRVEPDGLIFDGEIEATMEGESVALYDGREIKEPRLREGDSITIYGYGKGTTTVKVQDVSGWIPKTVDKYDIPSIDMRYIEFN